MFTWKRMERSCGTCVGKPCMDKWSALVSLYVCVPLPQTLCGCSFRLQLSLYPWTTTCRPPQNSRAMDDRDFIDANFAAREVGETILISVSGVCV